jgi:flagellar FliL protein
MADNQVQTADVPASDTPVSDAKPGASLIGKLLIGGFVSGVILAECAIAYLMIPTPEQVAAVTEERLAERMKETAERVGGDERLPAAEEVLDVEVDLGSYSITYPNGSTMLRIEVTLAGTILQDDKSKFDALFKEKERRYSQMVNIAFRSAELVDIVNDPNLDLIRRRILEKSNALFGQRILRDVVVSQYTTFEQ